MLALLSLLLLAGLMYTAQGYAAEVGETSTLIAFGYLMLSAYFGGEVCARWKLPKLTGYILVGVAAGPSALGLVDHDAVGELRFLGEVATALIALAGGAELELRVLRSLLRTITSIIFWAILGTVVVLTGTLLALRPLLPFLEAMPTLAAVAVASVLATVLAAQSPAVVMALIGETRATGPLTRIVLPVVILADLIVVVLFAILSSVASTVAGAGADLLEVPLEVSWELGGSIAVGLIVGRTIALFLRHVSSGVGLFTLLVCLVISQVAAPLHLDALVVMLAAGMLVQNAAPEEVHKLLDNFEAASLPVYLVFFAMAGAKVELAALATLAIPVSVVTVVRALSFWLGVRIAARRSDAPAVVGRFAWLGLLPQAGLALALAELLRGAFPSFGDQAFTLVLGVVGANQIIGPVLFRFALSWSGEAASSGDVRTLPGAAGRAPSSGTGH